MIHQLGLSNSLFNQFMAEVRSVDKQGDRMRFRRNLERLGEIFAYEISKTLSYTNREVATPLGAAAIPVLSEQPVIATVLRAGIPFQQGFLNYFDHADAAFVSAYRKHHKDGSFEIEVEYVSAPDLTGKTLILVDPMLATGSSMALVYKNLMHLGKPDTVHFASIIASSEGIEYVRKHLPENIQVWVGAIDEELTSQSYIVPGLGDAGDLAYGRKR